MALVGYARVSSIGQSLDVQLDKLKDCHKIFQEKASGASGRRPRLHACLEYVREGDILVVTRLDRLARSTLHLCQIATTLQRKQVDLQVHPPIHLSGGTEAFPDLKHQDQQEEAGDLQIVWVHGHSASSSQ